MTLDESLDFFYTSVSPFIKGGDNRAIRLNEIIHVAFSTVPGTSLWVYK